MIERENIEWTQHYWYDVAVGMEHLPRVLLIGDSIVQQSREVVRDRLKELATVVGFSTSKIAGDPAYYRELGLAMADYPIDLIVLNNGLHGMTETFPVSEYARGLRQVIEFLRLNSRARILWRNSTPVTKVGDTTVLDSKLNRMVIQRNEAAARIMAEFDIPIIDLYSQMLDHPQWRAEDGFHYLEDGCRFIGNFVAERIIEYLNERRMLLNINGCVTDFPGQLSNWHGYERHDFLADGVHCALVRPNCKRCGDKCFFFDKMSGCLPVKYRDLLMNGWCGIWAPSREARTSVEKIMKSLVD